MSWLLPEWLIFRHALRARNSCVTYRGLSAHGLCLDRVLSYLITDIVARLDNDVAHHAPFLPRHHAPLMRLPPRTMRRTARHVRGVRALLCRTSARSLLFSLIICHNPDCYPVSASVTLVPIVVHMARTLVLAASTTASYSGLSCIHFS